MVDHASQLHEEMEARMAGGQWPNNTVVEVPAVKAVLCKLSSAMKNGITLQTE